MTISAEGEALAEPVQFRGLLLIPVPSIPGVAMEVSRGESVRVPLGPWIAEAYTLHGDGVTLYEDAGLRYVEAPGLFEVRAAGGENALVGPGLYVLSGVPGAAGIGEPQAREVAIEDGRLVVVFVDGRELAVPLAQFPRLHGASAEDLGNYVLSGRGIRWERLNEDLSFAGLLAGFAHSRPKTLGA